MCGRVRARVLRQADFGARGAEPWTLATRLPLAATPGRRDLSAACSRVPVLGRPATSPHREYFFRSSFAFAMPASVRYTDFARLPWLMRPLASRTSRVSNGAYPSRGFIRHRTPASTTAKSTVRASIGTTTSPSPAPRSMIRRAAI